MLRTLTRLAAAFTGCRGRRRRTTQPRRLTLEALEDRTLLSTLVIDPKNIIISSTVSGAPQIELVNPASGGSFGTQVVTLANGNVVVTDPAVNSNAGAVYLFNGRSGALISTLSGNAGDQVGSGGITVLANGNFVVSSPLFGYHQGAVTWGSGTFGVSGLVSASNSLVGTSALQRSLSYSDATITPLTNGNYVVSSPYWMTARGSVTWGSGTTGVVGTISAANSLVGTIAGHWVTFPQESILLDGDLLGQGGVTALANGNYVIDSPLWSNSQGAVTWANGTSGLAGSVSAANSLVGSTLGSGTVSADDVGRGAVTALSNGNYVVCSPNWHGGLFGGFGAVTWASGTTGLVGTVSADNSLVGSSSADHVGGGFVMPLTNGNYVVDSDSWNGGVGAVTWGNGFIGTTGTVSAANSLVGSVPNGNTVNGGDNVGWDGITALANGDYVVASPYWNGKIGAATWGNGFIGTTGTVSAANSLVGSSANDMVGSRITALTNGNYVVASPSWHGNIGAATWGSGSTGIVGTVSAANSLVGAAANDQVSSGGITALAAADSNGDYVVASPNWNGKIGAATWGSGSTGGVGTVSAANSLVGAAANDQVSSGGVTALRSGNYVVVSPSWNGGKGAATWGSHTGSVVGPVSAANSLVGSTPNGTGGTGGDAVGSGGVTALPNGDYVVVSPKWNGARGAATWASGSSGLTLDSQNIDALNSLVGAAANAGLLTAVPGPDPGTFIANFTTENGGQVIVGVPVQGPLTFGTFPDLTLTVSPAFLTNALNAGTNVVLQADNDITISSPITAAPTGTAGTLTLDAGRSIILGASISTAGGKLTLIANDTAANGVVDADRDPGNANIELLSGATLNTGIGTLSLDIKQSTDKTNNGQGAAVLTTLAPASTTLSSTTALGFILNGTTPGDGVAARTYTQLKVTGPFNLNHIGLQLTHAPTGPTAGDTFTIIHASGGVTGTFAGLPEGATVTTQDGSQFTISYVANGGDDVTVTAVIPAGFSLDASSQTLTINDGAAQFMYWQGSVVDSAGTLHTTYDFAVHGQAIAYPDSQVAQVVVASQGIGNSAILVTNDTYVGTDGMTHETRETAWMRPGGGILYRYNAGGSPITFLQLSGFTISYAYVGRADDAQVTGVKGSGVENIFATGGDYSYVVGGGEFHLVSGARYVYGYAANAADQAWHYDSAGGLDAFVAWGNAYSYISGSDPAGNSFFNVAVGFQVSYGISTHGNAIAYLVDSPGNDVFFGATTYSYLSGSDSAGSVFNVAEGFALVFAESFLGGTDFAYNYDHNHNILGGNWIMLT
jgi:hypothetical protein